MKLHRPLIVAAAIAGVLAISNVLNATVTPSRYIKSYPAVVCPSTGKGLLTAISLSSSKTPFKLIGSSSTTFKPSKTRRYNQASSAAVFESNDMTPAVWQVRSGVWAGATICKSPISSQWFVGGASDVTSRGDLLLINSGLSPAIADVRVWNEVSEQPNKVVTIAPNSQVSVGLDALSPGSKAIVMQVVPRAGRLSAYMIDERGKGLKSLGGDIVNATTSPSKDIFIPAIPQTVKSIAKPSKKKVNKKIAKPSAAATSSLSHTIRVLNPSDVDARISVELASSEGSFSPVGLQDLVVPKGRVISIPFDPSLNQGRFGLHITSEQPVVAAVFSSTLMKGKSDFIWSTAAAELTSYNLALTGLSPEFVFIGGDISLGAEVIYLNGKRKTFDINGIDFVAYQVPQNVRAIIFSNVSKGVHGAALISTQSGSGYFPLEAGSVLTKSAVPTSSIQVLTP
ncbi:unannotated protein [freshwater metagenome]|uniref:Unannotated protein n=1 Tax=freshwater metagenome TaxID=449393 RepID=A0A6J7DS36_9ZZZZ|nr:hypothetical protein [Actinomycetota bacterium]